MNASSVRRVQAARAHPRMTRTRLWLSEDVVMKAVLVRVCVALAGVRWRTLSL